jgi:hypothetical protein
MRASKPVRARPKRSRPLRKPAGDFPRFAALFLDAPRISCSTVPLQRRETLRTEGPVMMLTLLTIAGAAAVLTAVYVLATKTEPAEALAGETTISSAADPAETLTAGRHVGPVTRTDWHLTTVSALSDAEELLDVLENQGFAERELVVLGNSTFAVRWR